MSGVEVATDDGATSELIAGSARAIDVRAVARESALARVEIVGVSGDRAGILVALQTRFHFEAIARGVATTAGARVL